MKKPSLVAAESLIYIFDQNQCARRLQVQNEARGGVSLVFRCRYFLILSFLLQLSSCIVMPSPGKEPYQETELAKVQPGETTRDEVFRLFGQPHVTREENAIWIYGDSRSIAVGITYLPLPAIGTFYDSQWIVIEFDADTVNTFDFVEDAHGCSSTGICLISGWRQTHVEKDILFPSDQVVIASKRNDDKRAKAFQPVQGGCSVYVYTEIYQTRFDINSIKAEVTRATYFRISVEANPTLKWITPLGGVVEQQIACGIGNMVFLKLDFETSGWHVWSSSEVRIKEVDPEKGQGAILKRSLILLP